MPFARRAHTCESIAFLNRVEHVTNLGMSVISPGYSHSRMWSWTRRTASSRSANALASVDFPDAILPQKKINFAPVLMS